MDGIALVVPAEEHGTQAMEYVREHAKSGETFLHGASGLEQAASYPAWLEQTRNVQAGVNLPAGWVMASTFFALRPADGRLVGVVNIRHTLNDFLRREGGHIGYGVRPGERRKGYAARILALALDKCRGLGLRHVLLTCDPANTASLLVIQKNGGVMEDEVAGAGNLQKQRYWIAL
ncbi:MAG: GNAT family N-acetyltransferase [Planctomycetes bacterium]|nr:GNAT family N-acetyltransferase [Planctomycetota bacterium]